MILGYSLSTSLASARDVPDVRDQEGWKQAGGEVRCDHPPPEASL